MSEPILSRRNVPAAALIHRRVPEGTGIVHLGLGNFHRAHQAVYTALAMEREPGPWGILGVASRSSTVADAMNAQDLLYSVVEISPDGSRVSVPGSHTGTLVAEQDPESVVRAIADPATKIVTITVTEHGYTVSPETGSLDLDSDVVRRDLTEVRTPRTTIGRSPADWPCGRARTAPRPRSSAATTCCPTGVRPKGWYASSSAPSPRLSATTCCPG